jgi:hypothetical protein
MCAASRPTPRSVELLNVLSKLTQCAARRSTRSSDASVSSGGRAVTAVEVKTAFTAPPRGLAAFTRQFPHARALVVGAGSGAISLEEFLARPAAEWLT